MLPSWAPECNGGICVEVAEQEFEGEEEGAGASVGPLRRASTSPSWGPEPGLVEEEEEAERESPCLVDQTDEDIHRSPSEVTLSESQEEEEEEEVEKISARMNTFRKEERKPSLFTRAIERLSFR